MRVIKYFTITVFQPDNVKLTHLANFTKNLCYVRLLLSKQSSLENKFSNLKRKLCISSTVALYKTAFLRTSRADVIANINPLGVLIN